MVVHGILFGVMTPSGCVTAVIVWWLVLRVVAATTQVQILVTAYNLVIFLKPDFIYEIILYFEVKHYFKMVLQ